jgi:endonuclease YncB( thermonuclease family)
VALTGLSQRWTPRRVEGRVLAFIGAVRGLVNASIAALLFALPLTSAANTTTGLVVGIADGDTLTLLDADHVQHKIRLAGIDAPEKRQAFGNRARQNLADLVFRRQVRVEWDKSDRYGRVIGKLLVGDDDVCLAQIRAGLAWHYKTYEREQSAADRERYAQAEIEARASKRGLWRDTDPTPPWDFRHQRRRGY